MCTLTQVLEILKKADKLSAEMVEKVKAFIKENKFEAIPMNKRTVSNNADNYSVPSKKSKKVSLVKCLKQIIIILINFIYSCVPS